MANLTVMEELEEAKSRITHPEEILGRGLTMPFNNINSGARKLLASSQNDQIVPVDGREMAIVSTGYENRYGDRSSSIIRAEHDYKIINIIEKYSFKPRYHYWVVFLDMVTGVYHVQEVQKYKVTSEKHGYNYNTEYLDTSNIGDVIPAGTIIRKSTAYDEYQNRMDGVNARTLYLATEKNTEDSTLISESFSWKMATKHFKETKFIVNQNARLLNRYGDDNEWKSFPDIGENVVNGIFTSTREANKKEELYTLSYDRLKHPIMSDENIAMSGTVIDIDVMSNNPQLLDRFYNEQLKKYYDESIRVATEIVNTVTDIQQLDSNAELSTELDDLAYEMGRVLKGDHFINDGREFNNICIRVVIEQAKPLDIGDKAADRYGGKGVVSHIIPDELMPRDQDGNVIDIIVNQSTCINRLNPGQLFEMEVTYISHKIVKYIAEHKKEMGYAEAFRLILEFYDVISPQQHDYYLDYFERYSQDPIYLETLINSIIGDEYLFVSVNPIEDSIDEDKLGRLYDKFPFIDKEYLMVPIIDSNGNVRYVKSYKKAIASMKYMERLKQYSEEKFSATSLSATNIKNLNTKSKSYKNYRSFYSNTPIAMGTMESDDLASVGGEFVITNLMINSVSPKARRLMKQALIGDPFTLDIQLDSDSSNRQVEILNTYHKAKGVALVFRKVRKVKKILAQRMVSKPPVNLVDKRAWMTPEQIQKEYNNLRTIYAQKDKLLVTRLLANYIE